MLKTIEDISATKKRLSIEIPIEAIEDEIRNSLGRLKKKMSLPGFRQGKAPMALIEKRFGKGVEAEAVEKVIPVYYSEALKEAEITPVSQPELEGGLDFKRHSPLNLTFTVEIRPKLEGLKYEGIKVKAVSFGVEDSEVEETLKRLQEERASYEPSEGPVKHGDMVVLDYEIEEVGRTLKDEVFEVGSELMPPGFSDGLTGLKKAEETGFKVEFPADFRDEALAGKELALKAVVREIKNVTLPAIDDEFAKDLEFEDMSALRARIRERIEASRDAAASNIMKAEVIKNILEAHEFEAPESLVKDELRHRVAMARGNGRKEEEGALVDEFRPQAERNVKAYLLINAIGEKEGVEVTEEEMRRGLVEFSTSMGLSPENAVKYLVSRDGSLEGMKKSLYEDKVLALLLERAEVVKED